MAIEAFSDAILLCPVDETGQPVSARDGDAALGRGWPHSGLQLGCGCSTTPAISLTPEGGDHLTEGTRVLADLDALERAVSGRERYRVACRIQRHAGSGADTSAECCVYLMSPT
jgi:hypothetical protein